MEVLLLLLIAQVVVNEHGAITGSAHGRSLDWLVMGAAEFGPERQPLLTKVVIGSTETIRLVHVYLYHLLFEHIGRVYLVVFLRGHRSSLVR